MHQQGSPKKMNPVDMIYDSSSGKGLGRSLPAQEFPVDQKGGKRRSCPAPRDVQLSVSGTIVISLGHGLRWYLEKFDSLEGRDLKKLPSDRDPPKAAY
jgi:hypothetical protein